MEDFSELYYQEPYVREFDAQVVACARVEGGWEIELSQTAFYPEGGGQPGDRGTLSLGEGETQVVAHVRDTHKRGDAVIHLADAELPVGATVHGALDWAWRSDNMEAHTGEHIVSGIVHKLFGYDNVGFHMGAESIEVDFNGAIDEEQALDVERRANAAVRADLPVRAILPSAEELAAMDYRSKKELEGVVRIVTIPGVDTCACCGTHLETTGRVGLVKILRVTSKKKGTRVELLCGRRALEYVEGQMEQARGISAALSAKPAEILDAVTRLVAEKDELKRQLKEAHLAAIDAEVAALPEGAGLLVRFEDGLDAEELRHFCNQALAGGRAATCAALSPAGDGERLNYVMASSSQDLRAACKELNARLSGRGGGRPEMVQGSFAAPRDQVETALRELLG